MFNALLQHISRFVQLTTAEQELVAQHFTYKRLSKKDFVLSEGDVCTDSYFVQKGLLRMYFIKDKGQIQLIQFALENWWITDQTSLDLQKTSVFFIDAVEDAEVAVLSKKSQEDLLTVLPQMERYFRLIMQRYVAAVQMRLTYLLDQSAEERYRFFSNSFPGFVQRIPQYMLASYLNITPEVLSKIKAKK